MSSKNSKQLTNNQHTDLLNILKNRFEKNMQRHRNIIWEQVEAKLLQFQDKCWSLYEMEQSGGEPDIVSFDAETNVYIFMDCCAETPKGRVSLCYDKAALDARKENKPAGSAMEMAAEMGVEILSEEQYRFLQQLGNFDIKTSSWLKTPSEIRKLGGAIFGDYRYGTVFIYHNGVQSYYAARGFRTSFRV
jgi:hypothetical protein